MQQLLEADTRSFVERLLEQQQAGQIQIPEIVGEAMPPQEGQDKTRPLTSDYLVQPEDEYDTVFSALTDYISGKARDLKLMPAQTEKYNGKNNKGKIWLLKGSQVCVVCPPVLLHASAHLCIVILLNPSSCM